MHTWVLLIAGVILVAIGAWTVTHSNGGYRGAAGVGSSFSPTTRRAAGFGLIALAALVIVMAAAGAI